MPTTTSSSVPESLICASQIFLTLTNFIEKNINIYDIK